MIELELKTPVQTTDLVKSARTWVIACILLSEVSTLLRIKPSYYNL